MTGQLKGKDDIVFLSTQKSDVDLLLLLPRQLCLNVPQYG